MTEYLVGGAVTVITLLLGFVKYLLNEKQKRIVDLEKKNESLTNQLIKRSRGATK